MLLKRNFGEPFGGNWKKIGNFCNFSAIFRDFWDLQICWDIWNLTRQAHFFYTVPFFMKIWLEVLLKIRSFKKKKTCIWVWWRDPPVACCLPTSGGVLYKVQSMHHKLHSCSFSTLVLVQRDLDIWTSKNHQRSLKMNFVVFVIFCICLSGQQVAGNDFAYKSQVSFIYYTFCFYRQLDFPSEPGVANEILENEPKSCLAVA